MNQPNTENQKTTESGKSQPQIKDESSASSLLHRLPNELILSILSHLYHDDLVNFVSTCRLVYGLAGQALDRHTALWGQYFALANAEDESGIYVFPRALTGFIQHPEHALYVQNLYVRPVYRRLPLKEIPGYSDASFHLVKQAARELNVSNQDWKTTWLERGLKAESCHKSVNHRQWNRIMLHQLLEPDQNVITALLILLLPNLKILTMSDSMFKSDAVDMALTRALSIHSPALSKLEMIELLGSTFPTYRSLISGLQRLARLPAFKCIRCDEIELYDSMSDYTFPTTLFSGITTLEYYRCRFADGPMLQLPGASNCLKHFVFTPLRDGGGSWMPDPYQVLHSIAESAKESLVTLELWGFQYHQPKGPSTRARSKSMARTFRAEGGCLRSFSRLEEITVDFDLLFDGPKFDLCTLDSELPSAVRTLNLHFEARTSQETEEAELRKVCYDLQGMRNSGSKPHLEDVEMTDVDEVVIDKVYDMLWPGAFDPAMTFKERRHPR